MNGQADHNGEVPVPAGYQQILAPGEIPAVDDPRFVSAADARLPDDAWVLGIVVEGQARAYSLNLLNRHEVVNDRVGSTAFAAVWCPLANTGVVYARDGAHGLLRFAASGGLLHGALVLRDRETGSYWPIMAGCAQSGTLAGARLRALPGSAKLRWSEWRRRHSDTLVLSVAGIEHVDDDPYARYFASPGGYRDLCARDTRLPTKEPIWAFEWVGRHWAVPHRACAGGRTAQLPGGWIFLHRAHDAPLLASTHAWSSADGFTCADGAWRHAASGATFDAARGVFVDAPADDPQPLPGFDTFWYTWSLTHPDGEIVGADPR